jgi:hypothetical protein
MGSTNFLQFNPSQAQQETDAEYLADATRLGGALDGNAWPDVSANKTLYQLSTAIAALMQMMANKGFIVSDANLGTLTAVLMNILTTADTTGGLQSLPWSPLIALNAAKYSGFEISLQGAVSFTISGQTAGQIIGLLWVQDATGGRTITFPANVSGGAQPDPTPGTLSVQLFKVDAAGNLDAVAPAVSVNGMTGMAVDALTLTVAGAAPNGQVLAGNGTSYVPQTAPGYSNGSSGGAFWQKDPSGKITQWGTTVPFGSGGINASLAVTFPNPGLFTAPPNVQCTPSGYPNSGNTNQDSMTCYSVGKSSSGFTVVLTAAVNIGGSGASGIVNVPVDWIAVGY